MIKYIWFFLLALVALQVQAKIILKVKFDPALPSCDLYAVVVKDGPKQEYQIDQIVLDYSEFLTKGSTLFYSKAIHSSNNNHDKYMDEYHTPNIIQYIYLGERVEGNKENWLIVFKKENNEITEHYSFDIGNIDRKLFKAKNDFIINLHCAYSNNKLDIYIKRHYLDLVTDRSISHENIIIALKQSFLKSSKCTWELVPYEEQNTLYETFKATSMYINNHNEKYIGKLIDIPNMEDHLFHESRFSIWKKENWPVTNINKKHQLTMLNNALGEKVRNDFFYLLSNKEQYYLISNTLIAWQEIVNQYSQNNYRVQILSGKYSDDNVGKSLYEIYGELNDTGVVMKEAAHYMSKVVDGYINLEDVLTINEANNEQIAFMDFIKKYLRPPLKIINPDSGELVKLKGLMHVLAAGVMLADWDVLGSTGTNCGVILLKNQQGEMEALCVKVDPGEAFYFVRAKQARKNMAFEHLKNIRYSLPAASESDMTQGDYNGYIRWDCLLAEQQQEFIESILYAVEKFVDIDEKNSVVFDYSATSNSKFLRLYSLIEAYYEGFFREQADALGLDSNVAMEKIFDQYTYITIDTIISIVETFEVYTEQALKIDIDYKPRNENHNWANIDGYMSLQWSKSELSSWISLE